MRGGTYQKRLCKEKDLSLLVKAKEKSASPSHVRNTSDDKK